MINQLRENIGNPYKPYKIPCGTAIAHACSQILWFTKGSLLDEKYKEVSSGYANPSGNLVSVKVEKNKVTKNDRRLQTYTLNYSTGVDEIKDTLDLAIMLGIISQAGAWFKATPRQMNGLVNLVNANNVVETKGALTEDHFLDALQKMWDHGAQGEYFSFVNANVKRMINNLAKAGNNVRFLGDNGSMQNVLGIGVQKIVTDFGEISLVLDRYADTKTILTVDLGEVQIAELRGTFYEDLPKAGDYYKGHVLNESTIKLLNSFAGSKISITEASL